MAGQTNHAHVMRKILAAELRADAACLGRLEQPGFHLQVAEGLSAFVACGRQVIQIAGGCELDCFKSAFGARAADDKGEVVRRAGRGAKGFHLGHQELFQTFRIEQRLGFLEQDGFVCAAAALGNEKELVFVPFRGIEIDLGRQIAAGIDLLVHVECDGLGIAQVFFGVCFENSFGKEFLIFAAGPDLLAFFADDGGCARVLTEGQFKLG